MTPTELRDRRRALGFTQAELGARIGLSRDYIGQMERGAAEISERTAIAVNGQKSARLRELQTRAPVTSDPMERLVEEALIDAGIDYVTDQGGGTEHRLDFHLPAFDVAIEVKRMHTPRVADQMARVENVIVAQGEGAVRFLAQAIRSGDFLMLARG